MTQSEAWRLAAREAIGLDVWSDQRHVTAEDVNEAADAAVRVVLEHLRTCTTEDPWYFSTGARVEQLLEEEFPDA